jgi:putative addiction module component (TIGR02574 family)
MPHPSFDFSHLSAAERIHLAQDLWDSIHDDARIMPLTGEQRAEIERRHAELESGAVQGIPLDELRQSLLSRR